MIRIKKDMGKVTFYLVILIFHKSAHERKDPNTERSGNRVLYPEANI